MKKVIGVFCISFLVQPFLLPVFSQNFQDSIQESEVSSILRFLSSDDLKGRGNFTPELVKAANFIANRFAEDGLQRFPGSFSFFQPFNAADSKPVDREEVRWNGKKLDQAQFVYFTSELLPKAKTLSEFNLVECEGAFTDSVILAHWIDTTNTIIWWRQTSSTVQKIPSEIRHPGFPPVRNILVVSDEASPRSLLVRTNKAYRERVLFNVIGVLPGKTKPKEIVIFSAHYDHLGASNVGIYNGANDDASGTTALLMLEKYFALRNDNARTILFCAFAGEELGLFGSFYLASTLKPDHIQAAINIEMIGRTNINGKNSFCVTGADYSTLFHILKANLRSSVVKVVGSCDVRSLFQRSDNFPFALNGVPAHTIMCSDDGDLCYHKTCDDFKTIDIKNMTTIIRAIAQSSQSIIDGKDTPSRINTAQFK